MFVKEVARVIKPVEDVLFKDSPQKNSPNIGTHKVGEIPQLLAAWKFRNPFFNKLWSL